MKRKKLIIDEEKQIGKIWKLAKKLKKIFEKIERDVGSLKKKKER